MPGIYEAKTPSEDDQLENTSENAQQDELNEQSPTTENEETPRETDQTDKINKFLLKSFLQHINSHPINMSAESVEQNPDESDADWN